MCVYVCVQNRVQAEGACADPVELEAALQQLKVAHMEQSRMAAEATPQVHGIFLSSVIVTFPFFH